MAAVHGFEKKREQEIPELKTQAELYRHIRTGAEVLSLMNEDENKVFGITFRTPPTDSTGVAHILEHSVLCGSRKYPVKEPFAELLKGSLQTFLNAMTYPDKTCYPVASQTLTDFYNLIDVYLDAVLYPRLTPFVLKQEGWHFELENKRAPLRYKGVVYNEMKGAYSSPDNLLSEYSQQSLFPDNAYGFDSGGDPMEIVHLEYEQFAAFHRTYYHPTNSRVFFYGDDDPVRRLKILDSYFKDFEARPFDSSIKLQPPFDQPRKIKKTFSVSKEGHQDRKGMITLNWMLEDATREESYFVFHILNHILLGMPGSPLRRALIESHYGEDLAGIGLGSELRQFYFSTGLKGIDVKDAPKIEKLILNTLRNLAHEGIDQWTKEAGLNMIEFSLRENNTGSYPRGLALMLRTLNTWLYDGDPFALIAFESPLEKIKARIKGQKDFIERIIETFFLDNQHRTTLIMMPDPELAEREEAREKKRLQDVRSSMGSSGIGKVLRDTAALKKIQETPDPPEALAAIPTLTLADLPRRDRPIPSDTIDIEGSKCFYHNLFTHGIVYLDIGLNLHTLPAKYLPYSSLIGRALIEMGTEKEDFITLSQRIGRKTGGIHSAIFTSAQKGSETAAVRLFLRAKAMMGQEMELLDILKDMILHTQLDNQERFRQMVFEEKARLEKMIVPSGHQLVNFRLRAHFTESDWAAEQTKGVSQLLFIRSLSRRVEVEWASVLQDLEALRDILCNRKGWVVNVTLDKQNWNKFQIPLRTFLEAVPDRPVLVQSWNKKAPPPYEGLTIPAQVNYVGKGVNLYAGGYRCHGSALVICRYLRNSFLWDQVRVRGGAYGAFCIFDRLSGTLCLISYRDPNLLATLQVFDNSSRFLSELDLTNEELAKAIIGTIGDIDQYRLPDAKGYISMVWSLTGDTKEERQRMREEVLSTSRSDFLAFADALEELRQHGLVTILGSQSAIGGVIQEKPGWIERLDLL